MTRPITGETWGDEVAGVRAYLLAEAELPFAELRLKLASARGDLLAELDGVSDAQAELRPYEGEGEDAWGIAEALRHVASIETIMAQRVRLLGLGLPVDVQATYPGYMESVDTRRLPGPGRSPRRQLRRPPRRRRRDRGPRAPRHARAPPPLRPPQLPRLAGDAHAAPSRPRPPDRQAQGTAAVSCLDSRLQYKISEAFVTLGLASQVDGERSIGAIHP